MNRNLRSAVDAIAAAHTERMAASRFGIVTAVDPVAGMIKVTVQPDNVETGWISDFALATGDATIYAPAEIGTQVAVEAMYNQGDEYSVIGRIFDVKAAPPKTLATGKPPQPGEFIATFASGDELYIGSGNIQITSPQMTLKGAVHITGPLTVDDAITATGDVVGAKVSLSQHKHLVSGNETDIPETS